MLESFKQLKQLKELQNAIQKEEITAEQGGVKIVMNGAFEIKEVTIAEGITGSALETAVRNACNDAVKKVQHAIAGKFASMQR